MTIFRNAIDDVLGLTDSAIDRVAEQVANDARRLAPIDTGTLRASIHVEKSRRGERDVVASAPYAGYVEVGTSRSRAQPFLRPALYQSRGKL